MSVSFLGTIGAIALVDSLNPAAIAIQLLLLNTPKPRTRSAAFILGTFLANVLAGWVLILGLDTFVESFFDGRLRFRAAVQLIAGLLFIVAGLLLPKAMTPKRPRQAPLHTGQSFLMGAVVNLLEIPTAFPYLAAIALIVDADLSSAEILVVLLGYNALFVLPLAVLLLIHVLLPARRTAWFSRIERLYRRWLPKLVGVLLAGFGGVLLADLAVASCHGGLRGGPFGRAFIPTGMEPGER